MKYLIPDDVFIIVHGSSCFPYTRECADAFKIYNNVVWSSWNDTPPETKKYIEDCGFHCSFNDYPEELGTSKLNWQKTGFLHGLNLAKQLGAKYVYKVRTDLDIPRLDLILGTLKDEIELGSRKLNILCFDELCCGQCDWCMFGTIEEMELFWSFNDVNVLSERGIAPQYFKLKGVPYNYTYESMKQLIDTHIELYDIWEIPINWLKHTKEDEHTITDHFSNRAIYH